MLHRLIDGMGRPPIGHRCPRTGFGIPRRNRGDCAPCQELCPVHMGRGVGHRVGNALIGADLGAIGVALDRIGGGEFKRAAAKSGEIGSGEDFPFFTCGGKQ